MLAADSVIAAACGDRIVTGGFGEGQTIDPATGVMGPSMVIVQYDRRNQYTLDNGYIQTLRVQVSAFVPNDPDGALALAKRAEYLLSPRQNPPPLLFADGAEISRMPERSDFVKDPNKGVGGADVHHAFVEVRFFIGRSLS